MARRRTTRKSRPRKRFRGLNVTNTALSLYQANAVVNMATGNSLMGFFMPASKPDGALDIKEIFDGLTGQGLFTPGTAAGGAWVGNWAGKPSVADAGLGGAIMSHVKAGALPAVVKIVGSNAAVKVARKMKVFSSMNKLVRSAGLQEVLKF